MCPEDEVPLWAFGIIVIPISILIGIATMTIGFTAWTIIVPLFFAGFKKKNFTLFEALFVSVLLDFVTSGFSTIVFAKQSKVDWALGIIFAFVAVFGSLFGLVFSKDFLLKYQQMFKNGLGYISLLIGLSFFFRAFRTYQQLKAEEAKKASASPVAPPGEDQSTTVRIQTESSHLLQTPTISITSTIPVDSQPPVTITPPKPSLLPEEDTDRKPKQNMKLKTFAAILMTFITGIASGLIGFGGGMIFVLLFMAVLKKDQLTSTGTGCFTMCILTAWLALIYQTGGSWLGFAEHIQMQCIWQEAVMVLIAGGLGTFVGSFFVLKLSPIMLNILVGSVLFVTGLVACIQAQLFPGDDADSDNSFSYYPTDDS